MKTFSEIFTDARKFQKMDELILAMPLVARHAPEDCSVDRDAMTWGEIEEDEKPSDNPFAVLQELKRK